ncbi:MAG: sulfur carrier protein ThiS [Actinomycetota bacterium]
MNSITVTVNGSSTDLATVTTIEQLLVLLKLPERGVAIAVNREVVARSTWSSRILAGGDSIEVVSAAAGG